MRWLRRGLVGLATTVLYAIVATSVAGALFGASDAGSMSVSSKRIFPTSQTSSAWSGQDSSSGTAAAGTDVWAAVDNRLFTSAALTTAFSASRYVDVTLSSPFPTDIPVSAMALNLSMAETGGGTSCVYVEVRRASTNAVLGTEGSSSTPYACSSTTTQATTTSNLTYVTSSTDADDLMLRIFMRNSSSRRVTIDRAVVTGVTYTTAFTLNETTVTDASSGVGATTPWALAVDDSTTYAPTSSWTTAFSATRYLKLSFEPTVPAAATITGATLRHAFASATAGQTSCIYIEVYSGTTLLATHGSSASPLACTTLVTQTTSVVSLPELDTATEVNNAVIRIYARNANSGATRHGLITLTTAYNLT
jgi:hypothetical protein